MPSYEEVDARGNKPFVPPESSRLQAAPADMAKALGVSLEEEPEEKPSSEAVAEDQKADEEAEKVIQSREARIQEKSEELYRTEERLALKDHEYLYKLVDSTDAMDRKLAGKILKRNAETFGASSPEELKLKLAKDAVTDPVEKKTVEMDFKLKNLEQKQIESDWSKWKSDNKVGEDLATVADEIRAQYPDMPNGDLLAMARGRMGLSQTSSKKISGSTAMGSSGAPETDESVYSSPLAKRLLKNPDSTMKFAKGYLRSLT